MENKQQIQDMMMEEPVVPQFLENPSLQDLHIQLEKERNKLLGMSFPSDADRHKVISRIRILRSSINMLEGYMQHFAMN